MPTLFTIGYEQHQSTDTLVAALRDAGVKRLVDVRELPLSRRRGFSKTGLAAALESAKIEYSHARQLGNPKEYRDLYKSGLKEEGERLYRAHLHNGSYSALIELAETLVETSTCLLCFEAAHEDCHRSVIVDALVARLADLEVSHLT